jgi:hypothetical protein
MRTCFHLFTPALVLAAAALAQSNSNLRPTSVHSTAEHEISSLPGLFVRDGRLVFMTVADYQNAADAEPAARAVFLELIRSLRTLVSAREHAEQASDDNQRELITEEFIGDIVNADSVVQIGPHIIRILPAKERVQVLDIAHEQHLADMLAGRPLPGLVTEFSTGDDVLELLRNGGAPSCREGGIGGRTCRGELVPIPQTVPAIRMQVKVDFNRYGVYFSLFAEVNKGETGTPVEIKLDCEPVRYKPRCRTEVGPYNVYGYQSVAGRTWRTQRFQSYQGSTNLNKVQLRARPRAYIQNALVATGNWCEIRVNY